VWDTPDIWLRRTVNPGNLTTEEINNLALRIHHDEDAEIYINGVLAASVTGYSTNYVTLDMSAAARNAVVSGGDNVIAVHCHQTTGGQYIDAGLVTRAYASGGAPIDSLYPVLTELLLHPSAAVRMNTLQAMPRTEESATAIAGQQRLNDPDPHVRLKAMLAVAEMPGVDGLEMFTDYVNLDVHSQEVFSRISGKVNEVSQLPAVPPLLAEVSVDQSDFHNGQKGFLSFAMNKAGMVRIVSTFGLDPGILSVYKLDGRVVAQRKFDGSALQGAPLILDQELYLIVLANKRGVLYKGKLSGLR
jgi:hypothetical protein